MWKQIAKFSNLRNLKSITTRAYLTDAYNLNQEWDRRLTTPILEKISADSLFVDLSLKFQQKRKITAIDVDIYCNKVSDKNAEEALDMAFKLRKTEQTSRMLDSTQHAIIRLLADHPESLMTVLNHRLEYGVFLDSHSANLLLDKFIKEKNYMVAARLATFQMLQEDFEHPITRYFSLLACYKFLDELQTFTDLIPPPPPEPEPQATGKSKKKKEEIKIRVRFLRNPYFDDHFDITDTNHLVGKTLLSLANELQSVDEVLANSVKLIGYALYQKYDCGNQFISEKKAFYKDVVEKTKALAEKVEGLDSNEDAKKFFDSLNNITTQKEGKVDEIIEGFVKKAVSENESKDIDEQRMNYELWNKIREERLEDEISRLKRIQRLEDIEKIQEEMDDKEKKLWFFENEEDIMLSIQNKHKYYPKQWFGKKKKPMKVDENYVPPEIDNITRTRQTK